MLGLIRDWRYRAQCRRALRHYAADGGEQILNSPDAFDTFCEGLPSVPGVAALMAAGPVEAGGDLLKQLFSWVWEHREEIIKFILEIIALFPK